MAQNGDDSLSLFPPPQTPDPSPPPPHSEIGQKLQLITKEFANFPLSPGDGPGVQFADGHLGDTLAAEFGDADERSPDAGSNGLIGGPPEEAHKESERQQFAIRDLMNGAHERDAIGENATGNGMEDDSSEKDREARSGSGPVEQVVLNQEIELVDESIAVGDSGSSLKAPSDVSSGGGVGISGRDTKGTSSSSVNVVKRHLGGHTDTSGDALYNIPAGDEEGRSRQRILAFAAKRYAGAVERNPEDYDALYNWALVLQESADNIGGDATTKDQLLGEACKKYEEATRLCPTLHEAFYNWAIAISDRAKIRGRTKEAEELWKQACKNYERAVQLNWNSPQALNNWGLALQELSGIVPIREKQLIVKTSIKKFRVAIQLQFDFHRAIYNLGTVLYGLAEDTFRSGRQVGAKESTPSDLYSQSAIYIAAAHALKPEYPVYKSALRLVRSMLPLPYLKIGHLTVSPYGDSLAPHTDWKRHWFVLDHEALYQVEKTEQKTLGQSPRRLSGMTLESSGVFVDQSPSLRIEVADIAHLSPCADLSIPSGAGFCIDTAYGQQYLVADTWEAVDGWVDAIRLVYTIYVRGQSDILGGIIAG